MTSITTSTDWEWCVSYLDHDSGMTKDRFLLNYAFRPTESIKVYACFLYIVPYIPAVIHAKHPSLSRPIDLRLN